MKQKIIILGGGVSGISAAFYGIKRGFDVTLVEANSSLGGRINSRIDSKTLDSIDNGQHLLVGAYEVFLDILKNIKTYEKIQIQNNFYVKYFDKSSTFNLEEKYLKGQIGLLFGLLVLNNLNLSEKISAIKFILKIKLNLFKNNHQNLLEILKTNNQSDELIRVLWEPMCLATLNTPINIADTSIFTNVLKQSFFAGGFASKMIIPKVGLSDLISPFEEHFIKHGGKLLNNHSVKDLVIEDNKIKKVILTKNQELEADYIISCLPYDRLNKLVALDIELESSPIISAYLWYDEVFFDDELVAVLDKNIQWIFNKRKFGFTAGEKDYPQYLSIVISDAVKLMELGNEEILSIITNEIDELFPLKKNLLHHKIIKEKKATFLANSANQEKRRNIISPYDNLLIAGDWTDLTLPSTIETAAKSGKLAISRIS